MVVVLCGRRPRASGRTAGRCLMKNRDRSVASTLLLVLAFLFSSTVLRADVTGSILGVVHDSTQAVVAGARVVATNVQTNFNQETVSAADGSYRILALPAGVYKLTVPAPGFRPFTPTSMRGKTRHPPPSDGNPDVA